jgi:serine/threonine protein kinase
VYRDVKPQNIWYDSNGKQGLSDFVLALKKQAFGKAAQRRD